MNFTITANGEKCKALEKRVSLQLEDESVFSAVVRIENNEIILNKVQIRTNVLCCSQVCFYLYFFFHFFLNHGIACLISFFFCQIV